MKKSFIRQKYLIVALLMVTLSLLCSCKGQTHSNTSECEFIDYQPPREQERYLAIGFDDLRESDFSMVIPIFSEYGAQATFNRIGYSAGWTENDTNCVNVLLANGEELGDHTWMHCNYIFSDPMFNGQNPNGVEGNQIPFPSNEQLRVDRGDGRNAFGFLLTDSCQEQLSDWNNYTGTWTAFETCWGDLSDEECQYIREYFSVMNGQPELLDVLDELSNKYLGTTGTSRDSWDDEMQCYQSGIFTGCKTSANHEIWERILQVTSAYYEEMCGEKPVTWSWPGSIASPFHFEKDGCYYYDEEATILYNYLARFPSSLYYDEGGEPLYRSWDEVLAANGYLISHDTIYPSRMDGTNLTMMSKQLIYNASLSRENALVYRTNSSVGYNEIAESYDETFFSSGGSKGNAAQMYDAGGPFYEFIESIRQDTANGMVHGEVIDSVDCYSERMFLTEMLNYCQETGVKVITKKEAYSVCFEEIDEKGNLIYNADFRNTAEEFMPDAENLPTNPDGYVGDCYVKKYDGIRSLCTNSDTSYLHYGIPTGKILYGANTKGKGTISIYAIKNSDEVNLDVDKLELLAQINVDSSSDFDRVSTEFVVVDNEKTTYEQQWAGLGNKIMGLKIVYSEGLIVNKLSIIKTESIN